MDEVVEIEDYDQDITLRVRLDDHVGSQIFWTGYYNRALGKVLDRILEPGMVVLDVGAYLGDVALMAAKRVGPTGKVYAFEPCREGLALLRQNVDLNDLPVDVIEAAVSAEAGVATLFVSNAPLSDGMSSPGLASLVRRDRSFVAAHRTAMVDLDTWCASRDLERLDLVKIDVEGSELRVIKGATAVLERHAPFLILEVESGLSRAAGHRRADVYREIEDMGYRMYAIEPDGRLNPGSREHPGSVNVLCVPDQRSEQLATHPDCE